MSSNIPNFRVGIGYDVHQLVTGRPLILGGVEIQHTHGLDGHSDADVLCHAIADAILGALGEPDIGHFSRRLTSRSKASPAWTSLRKSAASPTIEVSRSATSTAR